MRRFSAFCLLAVFVGSVSAQGVGIGYSPSYNQALLRLGLEVVDLEFGLGMDIRENSSGFSLSGTGSVPLLRYSDLTASAGGTVYIGKQPHRNDADVSLFGGLMPEIRFFDHFIVGARVGVEIEASPGFRMTITGTPISEMKFIYMF